MTVNLALYLILNITLFTAGTHLMGMQGPKYRYASVMFDPLSANQILSEKRTIPQAGSCMMTVM